MRPATIGTWTRCPAIAASAAPPPIGQQPEPLGEALYQKLASVGAIKGEMPVGRIAVLGLLAGAYVSFGAW